MFSDSLFSTNIDNSQIAGGAVLVFQNDNMLLKKTYGYASLELSSKMPEEPIFEIGSVTKQFTAAAILQLDKAGKLSLDDDFTKYIDFDTKGRSISIARLLDHTSGIPSYTEIPEFWKLSVQDYPQDSLVRLVEKKDYLFEPGEALIYNNSAYFMLGLIIEELTGQSYEGYLEDNIFKPLGMDNTHYCSTTDVYKDKVYGYNFSPDGLKQKPYLNHKWPYAAGSLCSTTEDLLIWMRALHLHKLLPKDLYQSLITPNNLKDGSIVHYAKGVVNYSDFGHHRIGHGGGINGFLSDTRYYPDADLFIVCLINTTGPKGATYFADQITWHLLDKNSPPTIPLDISTKDLEGKYTGAVRGSTRTLILKSIDNGITVQSEGETIIDTLDNYVGNSTWMDENNTIVIENNEYRIDQISGYYVLTKETIN